MTFQPEPVDLARLVKGVLDILRPLAVKKQICITTEIDPSVTDVILDTARFKQVLYNYLSNAIKFTPDAGEIVVRIKPEQADTFRLEVQDTGIGISPEELERLFVEFQQLDSGTAKKYQGTGLGLALTRRLVEAQGGSVGVHSVSGIGSTFFAILPRMAEMIMDADAIGEEAHESDPLEGDSVGRPCILIVDDDVEERERVVQACLNAGYIVDLARTGREALDKCRQRAFDAIILDLDIDGWDVLRIIHAEELNHDVPIIIIKAMHEESIGVAFALQEILTKPVQLGEVQQALRAFLARIECY